MRQAMLESLQATALFLSSDVFVFNRFLAIDFSQHNYHLNNKMKRPDASGLN